MFELHGNLVTLTDETVRDAFMKHGAIAFVGSTPTPHEFDAFARRFTKELFLGYGRAPFADLPAITMANESGVALAPHADNGLRPEAMRPDITWFFVETPAADAGETTFYDGVCVWEALAPSTKALLESRRIRFVTRYAWRQMRFPDRAAFEKFIAANGASIVADGPDGSVDVEILTSALRTTRWGGERAFSSSWSLAGTSGFEGMRVGLEGGDALPDEIRADVARALDACRFERAIGAGEIVMLDNTRFLHGRNAYSDKRRTMYLIQTMRASF